MDVYFATNRNVLREASKERFGTRFHADGPQFYRVGRAEVKKTDSKDPDKQYEMTKVVVARESVKGEPVTLGSSEIWKRLQKKMLGDKRDVLIYIHGFASGFPDSAARAAQLADVYSITRPNGDVYQPYMFMFSWPSNGKVTPPWEYFSDRDDAEASGKAMARALIRLLKFLNETREGGVKCEQQLHLVAHSMGAWALRHTVQGMRSLIGDDALRPVFDNVFLMAADEDDDTLESANEHKLGLLPKIARRVHVYHSADDGALIISDKTKLNPDRLGFNGPRTFSGLSTRITAIDCALVDKTKLLHVNHQYYRISPEVIHDVRAVLSGVERREKMPWREVVEPGRRFRIKVAEPGPTP